MNRSPNTPDGGPMQEWRQPSCHLHPVAAIFSAVRSIRFGATVATWRGPKQRQVFRIFARPPESRQHFDRVEWLIENERSAVVDQAPESRQHVRWWSS